MSLDLLLIEKDRMISRVASLAIADSINSALSLAISKHTSEPSSALTSPIDNIQFPHSELELALESDLNTLSAYLSRLNSKSRLINEFKCEGKFDADRTELLSLSEDDHTQINDVILLLKRLLCVDPERRLSHINLSEVINADSNDTIYDSS
jgi:hypothetical protein